MNRFSLISLLYLASLGCGPVTDGTEEVGGDALSTARQATTCAAKITVFPVRAKHNTGWDSKADKTSLWTCDDANSNEDFIGSGADKHLGVDIWGAKGAPIAATVDGTLVNTGFISGGGNRVNIRDACGW